MILSPYHGIPGLQGLLCLLCLGGPGGPGDWETGRPKRLKRLRRPNEHKDGIMGVQLFFGEILWRREGKGLPEKVLVMQKLQRPPKVI